MTRDEGRWNVEGRGQWEEKAEFWDRLHGDGGNGFSRSVVEPAVRRLLGVAPGERVVDAACGNGSIARGLASAGAEVTAFDFCEALVERARSRARGGPAIRYVVADATDEEAVAGLGEAAFDAAVCTMALMDMPAVAPLYRGLARLLRPGGRFVFVTAHPVFDTANPVRLTEEVDDAGRIARRCALRLNAYLDVPPTQAVGARDEPRPHNFYHRPLAVLLRDAFAAGFVLDALEEPSLAPQSDFSQFPPVLAGRLRKLPIEDRERVTDRVWERTFCAVHGRAYEKGTLLNGRWRLGRLLGAGAMGDVYEGHDAVLRRGVAVKILAASLVDNASAFSRFQREALASARLAHPNVVTTLDFGVHDGAPFIAMELATGTSLDRLLGTSERFEIRRAARLALDVARGLEAAHRQAIVHRDIKPGNIMVSERDGVEIARVMDFGVAQSSIGGPRLTLAGGAVGTPGYIAPEQLSGGTVTPAADVYALGITLYEMLAGRLPWSVSEPVALLAAALQEPPERLDALRPDAPAALRDLVWSMIAKEPVSRPALPDVARVLDHIIHGDRSDATTGEVPATAVVVASVSRDITLATAQLAWLRQAVDEEGGTVAQSVRNETVVMVPSAEAAIRLARTSPGGDVPRPALALHLGRVDLREADMLLGTGVRIALRLARVAAPGEVLLTDVMHDAIGLGWRGRLQPRGEVVLDAGTTHEVYVLDGTTGESGGQATLEMHANELHWRCPCSAHGVVPATAGRKMRLRCSRCSRLLEFDAAHLPRPAAEQGDAASEEHPLSSIVLTAPATAASDQERLDNNLVAALTGRTN